MIITAEMVQQLREKTGEGMMACKKALTYSKGDLDVAVDYLRRAGTHNAVCVTTSVGRTARVEESSYKQDAERFRWLRANNYDTGSYHHKHEFNANAWFEHLSDEDIDAAILDEQVKP